MKRNNRFAGWTLKDINRRAAEVGRTIKQVERGELSVDALRGMAEEMSEAIAAIVRLGVENTTRHREARSIPSPRGKRAPVRKRRGRAAKR